MEICYFFGFETKHLLPIITMVTSSTLNISFRFTNFLWQDTPEDQIVGDVKHSLQNFVGVNAQCPFYSQYDHLSLCPTFLGFYCNITYWLHSRRKQVNKLTVTLAILWWWVEPNNMNSLLFCFTQYFFPNPQRQQHYQWWKQSEKFRQQS